ncbi:hypothetical protein DVW02_09035 [Clostridium botulinum]|nr:hypothetical protein [Clostridium botulinum]
MFKNKIRDNNLQIKCARESVKLIKYYIENGILFNQETTLSGNSIIKNSVVYICLFNCKIIQVKMYYYSNIYRVE